MWKVCLTLALAVSIAFANHTCGFTKPPALGVSDAATFPWIGLVYYSDQDENKEPRPRAIAILVDEQHVIVPAYATRSTPDKALKYIQFGTTDVDNANSAQNYTVLKIIVHPEYKASTKPTNTHDIALIRLAQQVTFSDTLSPTCLPQTGQNYDAEKYHFVSYNTGLTFDEEDRRKKHVSQLPRIKPEECHEKYKKHNLKIINTEDGVSYTCAGDKENDSCSGDAGSPLLVQHGDRWTAVAISIFGPRACKSGVPSAFLNLEPYIQWIHGVIAGQ